MVDEPVVTEQTQSSAPEVPPTEEPQDVVSKAELEALKAQNAQLEKQLEMLRSTLMSPEYLNMLRGLGAQAAPQVQQQAAPPPPEPEPDFENMTPKQLVDYVVNAVRRELEPKLTDAVSKAEFVRAQQEVQECAAKYPDFWMYRDAMYNIVQQFEARGQRISAEEAYFLAKGRTMTNIDRQRQAQAKPKPAPKPPVSEKPSAGVAPGTTSTKSATSLRDAFERAWKESGLGG